MINAQKQTLSLLLAPASQTNSATRTANLDTLGADYATIVLTLASALNTNAIGPTIKLLESDDTTASNFATIVANRTAEDISVAKVMRYDVDCRARKRYLRLSVTTETTTNDNVTMGVAALLSRKELSPTNTAELATAAVLV